MQLKMHGFEGHHLYKSVVGKYDSLGWYELTNAIHILKAEDFINTDEIYLILKSAHLEKQSLANLVAEELVKHLNQLGVDSEFVKAVVSAIETGAVSTLHFTEVQFLNNHLGHVTSYYEYLQKNGQSDEVFAAASSLRCFTDAHIKLVRAMRKIVKLRSYTEVIRYDSLLTEILETSFKEGIMCRFPSYQVTQPTLAVVETASVTGIGIMSYVMQVKQVKRFKMTMTLDGVDWLVLNIHKDAHSLLVMNATRTTELEPKSYWDSDTQKFIAERMCVDTNSTSGTWLMVLRLMFHRIPERLNQKHAGYRNLVAHDGQIF